VGESDAALIAASLDQPARFGPIFDRHATVLHRYLVRRIGADEADGLLGEVFRIAFEKRCTFDAARSSSGSASARPWLYGIATNLVAKHRRSEARRYYAVARLAARGATGGPALDDQVSDAVDARDRWLRVAAAVAELPAAERDALILHVWEGLAYEDVAAALGIPVGTVRSRLNRARGRLREPEEATGGEAMTSDRRDPGSIGS
jgi:RNA polymerase sigma-70 factor (ECF subfamily)